MALLLFRLLVVDPFCRAKSPTRNYEAWRPGKPTFLIGPIIIARPSKLSKAPPNCTTAACLNDATNLSQHEADGVPGDSPLRIDVVEVVHDELR